MSTLPPPGRWAVGVDGQALAEALVTQAQREGLRTGWLSAEAGFLSNLNIQENLHLFLDWVSGDGHEFEAALARASVQLGVDASEWLHARPAHLRAGQLLRARLLRLLLLRPGLVVLQPALLAQAGSTLADPFIAALAGSRLLLLAEPTPEWPAWPPAEAAATAAAVAPVGFAAASTSGALADHRDASAGSGVATLSPAVARPADTPDHFSDPDAPAAAEDRTP